MAKYKVDWQAVSTDGHKTKGTYSFDFNAIPICGRILQNLFLTDRKVKILHR